MDQILSRELRKVLKIQISEVHMYIVSALTFVKIEYSRIFKCLRYASCGHEVSRTRALGPRYGKVTSDICGITFLTTHIHHMLLTMSYSESTYPITPV